MMDFDKVREIISKMNPNQQAWIVYECDGLAIKAVYIENVKSGTESDDQKC